MTAKIIKKFKPKHVLMCQGGIESKTVIHFVRGYVLILVLGALKTTLSLYFKSILICSLK